MMRDWRDLTQEEREAERDKVPCSSSRESLMRACFSATLQLLKDDQFAEARARKISWGSYLINTPEVIASYCREAAHRKD